MRRPAGRFRTGSCTDTILRFLTGSGQRDIQGVIVRQNLEKTLEIALETADETKALEALKGLWEEAFSRSESSDEFHEAVLYMNSFFTRMIQKQGWTVKSRRRGYRIFS